MANEIAPAGRLDPEIEFRRQKLLFVAKIIGLTSLHAENAKDVIAQMLDDKKFAKKSSDFKSNISNYIKENENTLANHSAITKILNSPTPVEFIKLAAEHLREQNTNFFKAHTNSNPKQAKKLFNDIAKAATPRSKRFGSISKIADPKRNPDAQKQWFKPELQFLVERIANAAKAKLRIDSKPKQQQVTTPQHSLTQQEAPPLLEKNRPAAAGAIGRQTAVSLSSDSYGNYNNYEKTNVARSSTFEFEYGCMPVSQSPDDGKGEEMMEIEGAGTSNYSSTDLPWRDAGYGILPSEYTEIPIGIVGTYVASHIQVNYGELELKPIQETYGELELQPTQTESNHEALPGYGIIPGEPSNEPDNDVVPDSNNKSTFRPR